MKSPLNGIKTATTAVISAIAIVAAIIPVHATPSLGLQTDIVLDSAQPGSFPLEQTGSECCAPAKICRPTWNG